MIYYDLEPLSKWLRRARGAREEAGGPRVPDQPPAGLPQLPREAQQPAGRLGGHPDAWKTIQKSSFEGDFKQCSIKNMPFKGVFH